MEHLPALRQATGLKSKLTLTQEQLQNAIEMYLTAHNLIADKITFGFVKGHSDMRTTESTSDRYYAEVEFIAGRAPTRPTTRSGQFDDH